MNEYFSVSNLKPSIFEGVYYTAPYTDAEITSIVRGAKLKDTQSIYTIAEALYAYITHITTHEISSATKLSIDAHSTDSKYRILLIHSPSTTFALGERSYDHMALVLEQISQIHRHKMSRTSEMGLLKIDVLPHAILIKKDHRQPQHHKNRKERQAHTFQRFRLVYGIDKNFISHLRKYQHIFVLDDVITTGATLIELKHLISTKCKTPHLVTAIAYAH